MSVARPVSMYLISFGNNSSINRKSRGTFVTDPFTYHANKRYNENADHKKEHYKEYGFHYSLRFLFMKRLFILKHIKLMITSSLLEKLIMSSLFHYLSVREKNNVIGMLNG